MSDEVVDDAQQKSDFILKLVSCFKFDSKQCKEVGWKKTEPEHSKALIPITYPCITILHFWLQIPVGCKIIFYEFYKLFMGCINNIFYITPIGFLVAFLPSKCYQYFFIPKRYRLNSPFKLWKWLMMCSFKFLCFYDMLLLRLIFYFADSCNASMTI